MNANKTTSPHPSPQSGEGEPLVLRAKNLTADLQGTGKIMFAPAGDHEICCGCGPGGIAAAVLTVRVDRSTAAVLNASLAKLNAEEAPQKALFDFEHQAKEAMAWPSGFEFVDGPNAGVYATAEFSKMGKEYVEGKVVRAFSGSFVSDADLPKNSQVKAGKTYEVKEGKRGSPENPARITGLCFPYAGTLTNNPAFRANAPLWASQLTGASVATREGACAPRSEERIAAVDNYFRGPSRSGQ